MIWYGGGGVGIYTKYEGVPNHRDSAYGEVVGERVLGLTVMLTLT